MISYLSQNHLRKEKQRMFIQDVQSRIEASIGFLNLDLYRLQ